MDQHKVNHLSVDRTTNSRRTFFKSALSISGAATLTALAGVAVPEIASAHSLKPHIQLPAYSNLTLLYRLFSPRNGDHFYTVNRDEANKAVNSYGYNDEGSACFVLSQSFNTTAPLYRLYNPKTGDHFYTTNEDESNKAAQRYGYNYEGIACYVLYNHRNVPFALPLYRLYNSQSGNHFYTTSSSERDSAAQGGYSKEGIACYVL